MAIAWTTIAILVLLLPGFLFFTGLHAPARFSRDTTPRSAVGQLAAIVLVSLGVHILLLWTTRLLGLVFANLPHVDLWMVLSALQAGTSGTASVRELSRNLSEHWFAIPSYLAASTALGFLTGLATGRAAIAGHMSFVLEHQWVYELVPPPRRIAATQAYVLTKVKEGERCLLYRGPLHQFGLRQDGKFSYLVLRRAERFYLKLDPTAPRTTAELAVTIGESHREFKLGRPFESPEVDFLYLNGDEISNVVFERYTLDTPVDWREAMAAIGKSLEALVERQAGAQPRPAARP